jgi:hypothetical protein
LNRLENQVMHDQIIIPNNSQERTVVFVPKGILDFAPAFAIEGRKETKPSIAQVMSLLGELTLVGRHVKYLDMEDREIVVARTDGTNGPNASATPTTQPAASSISVDSVTPKVGTVFGGNEVKIKGSGFTPGEEVKVKFGGDPFVWGKATSATEVTAIVPPRAAAGDIYVEIIAGNRTSKLTNGYRYFDKLKIEKFEPASVPLAGGVVKIRGKGFMSGAVVTIDGVAVAVANVSVNDPTEITVTVPAHAAGPVTVEVKNPDGQPFAFANALTYVAPPTPATPSPTPAATPAPYAEIVTSRRGW